MDGKSFFYTNAMEIRNSHEHQHMEAARSGWFTCSCCPTNITRLIPSVPGYIYAQKGNDVYVNLFISGTSSLTVNNKQVQIEQKNNYPWDGKLAFHITPKATQAFNLLVRIPGWTQGQAMPSNLYTFENASAGKVTITVNGKSENYTVVNGYAVLNRKWKKGDVVEVNLPMDVQRITASKKVEDDLGKVAIQRGPLIYCAEWPDNNGKVSNIVLPKGISLTPEYKADLLNGVTVLKGETTALKIDSQNNAVSTVKQNFVAIPYYAWAHRGKGEMTIWFPATINDVTIISK
jgi:DUF1680 family protein